MSRRLIVLGVLLAAAASLLEAHDLFLKLDTYFLEPDSRVRVAVLNGTFALSENYVTPDRVADISVVTPAGRTRLRTGQWSAQGDTSVVTIRTSTAGTYVLGVSTRARVLELAAEDFNAYLEHDGIPDILAARTRDNELDQSARERYAKHVKAVFQVGTARSDGYQVALGYPAEIVPLRNPYTLQVGDELAVRCLVDGRPVAYQLVIAGGEDPAGQVIPERALRSDGQGLARVRLDAPGKWYVKFIHMVKLDAEGVDYESKWATLTFELR